MKKRLFLLFIMIVLIFTGCSKNRIVITKRSNNDSWKEDLFKDNIIDKISSTQHVNQLYDYLLSKDNNEYSIKYNNLYKKIKYDKMSNLNKDIIDSIYNKIFLSKNCIYSIDIKKIMYIGYSKDDLDNLLLININCNDEDMYIEYVRTSNSTDIMSYNKYSLFNQDYKIDTTLDEIILEYDGDNDSIKKLNGKTLKVYSKAKILSDEVKEFIEFLVETRKEIDLSNKESSDKCDLKTESDVKNTIVNSKTHSINVGTAKVKFHKVNKCQDTDIQLEDNESYYNVIVSGTCNGYTDKYDDDFNILYYTYEYKIMKSNCQINAIKEETKWKY